MRASRIVVTRCGNVAAGDRVVSVDDDDATTETVNDAYRADEQDWMLVVGVYERGDGGSLVVDTSWGVRVTIPVAWDATIWKLEEGKQQ